MAIPILSHIGRGLLAVPRAIGGAIDNAAAMGLLDPNGLPPSSEDRARMRSSWLMNVGGALAQGLPAGMGAQNYQQSELMRYYVNRETQQQERQAMLRVAFQAQAQKVLENPTYEGISKLAGQASVLGFKDEAESLLKTADAYKPTADEAVGEPFIANVGGQRKLVQRYKSGRREVLEDIDPAIAGRDRDIGGEVQSVDPYSGAVLSTTPKTLPPQTPAPPQLIAREGMPAMVFDPAARTLETATGPGGRPVQIPQTPGSLSTVVTQDGIFAMNTKTGHISPTGLTPPTPDAYRVRRYGLDNAAAALANYRDTLNRLGTQIVPGSREHAALSTAYQQLSIDTKNLFELGALTNADIGIIQGTIADPTTLKGAAYGKDALLTQLEQVEKRIGNNRRALDSAFGVNRTATPRGNGQRPPLASFER